jgi:nitrogen fixation NifU-like protein
MHVRVDAGACVVGFEGEGCALALAAASALCEVTQGLTPEAARAISARLIEALEAEIDLAAPLPGDLPHLLAVRAFPARVGCVRLAPTVLGEALAELVRATS